MLIDLPEDAYYAGNRHDGLCHPDMCGILMVINDIFEKHGAAFGTQQHLVDIKNDLSTYISAQRLFVDVGLRDEQYWQKIKDFFSFFAERLDHYRMEPFVDQSFACIACDDDVSEAASPILRRFHRFYDIQDHFWADNAYDLVPEKVDYFVTSNVLNDPASSFPFCHNIIYGIGNRLKEGGMAIHMLGYSEEGHDPYRKNGSPVGDLDCYARAGQRNLYNIPNGSYDNRGYNGNGTQMMVFEQEREVDSVPLCITNAQGVPLFTYDEFREFLRMHPQEREALEQVGMSRWAQLNCGSFGKDPEKWCAGGIGDILLHQDVREYAYDLVESFLQFPTPVRREDIPVLPDYMDGCVKVIGHRQATKEQATQIIGAFDQWRESIVRDLGRKIAAAREAGELSTTVTGTIYTEGRIVPVSQSVVTK